MEWKHIAPINSIVIFGGRSELTELPTLTIFDEIKKFGKFATSLIILVPQQAAGIRYHAEHEPARQLLGQRRRRELFQDGEAGITERRTIQVSGRCACNVI